MIIFCANYDIYNNFIHNSINEYLSWLDVIYDNDFLNHLNLDYCLKKYNKTPDVIVIMEIFSDISKLRSLYKDAKIVTYTNDVHYWNNKDKMIKYNTYINSDYIIAYYNKFKRYYNIEKQIYLTNHNCCSIFKRDEINLNPIKKIFFYGKYSKHYPLRVEFINSMKKYKDKLVIYDHPGYTFKSKEEAFEKSNETAKKLNNYFCAFTCGLFPEFEIKEKEEDDYYLIGKFFEIMGNGPLLLCNDYKVKSQLEKLGYYRDKHYIHIDKNNFDSVIKFLYDCNNSNIINDIRKRAQQHTNENYISSKMNRKINNFLIKLERNEDVSEYLENKI